MISGRAKKEYEIWLEGGNMGTINDYLNANADIKGPAPMRGVPEPVTTTGTTVQGTYATPSGAQGAAYPENPLQQFVVNQTVMGAGWNTGAGPVNGGWSVQLAAQVNYNILTRGIAGGLDIVASKMAAGDLSGIYAYIYGIAGLLAGSDEGVSGINAQVSETSIGGTYNVTSTSGTGDIAPVLSNTGVQCADMTLLLNLSKGTLAGSLNGASAAFGSTFINELPVTGVSLPLTKAWGTCTTIVHPPGTTQDVGQSVTLTMTLGSIGGALKPFVAGAVSVAGDGFPEQSVITAAGSVSGTTQSITLLLRYGNNSFVIFQGGIAGQCISSDANLSFTGVRSSYRAFGSLTGSDMIYAVYVTGGCTGVNIPRVGAEVFSNTGANAGFHLYPYAEIVKNASTTSNGNVPVLEPNIVPWAPETLYTMPMAHILEAIPDGLPSTKTVPHILVLAQ